MDFLSQSLCYSFRGQLRILMPILHQLSFERFQLRMHWIGWLRQLFMLRLVAGFSFMFDFRIFKQWHPIFLMSLCVLAPLVRDADGNDSTKSRIKIDRETTFLTGPLRTDGTVDYPAGINGRMKQGVTPEHNACVLLCEAMRPLKAWEMPPEYFQEIPRTPPPRDRSYVRYLAAEVADPLTDAERQRVELILTFIEDDPRPWTRSEFPEVAKVLDGDDEPLKTVAAAAKRDRFYSPIMTRGLDDVDPVPLVAAMDPMTTQMPYMVHSLRFRAMLNLGEGNQEAAWKDLLACFKLARLIGMGPSKIHAQRHYMLEELNCAAMEVFIRETDPSAVQAKRYLDALRSLPSRARLSEKVDLFERCACLDSLLVIRANQEGAIAYLDCEPGLAAAGKMVNLFWKDAIDWNKTLRIANRYYDRLVESLEKSNAAQRHEEAKVLQKKLKGIAEKSIGIRGTDDTANGRATTESKSEILAAIVAANLMSDIDKYLLLESRVKQRFAKNEITLALAARRKETRKE
ncbi:MAG TPA: hypothetical protein DEF45_25760 [Rhodopirellula sp.]|nr:hypothetical protein [Rhodopirellula sp.]